MGVSQSPTYSKNSYVEFRTSQIKPIKSIFDAIKDNLPDTTLLFSREGMMILQLDSTNTFMVNVRLNGENFEHYYCNPERDAENKDDRVAVNLPAIHLNTIFKGVKADDNMLAFLYERGTDVVKLIFSSDKISETRTYTISTQHMDDDIHFGEIVGIESYSYCLSFPCSNLQSICRDFKNSQCEKVSITHDGQELIFSGLGPAIQTEIKRQGQATDKIPTIDGGCTYSDTFKFSIFHAFSKCQSGGDNKIVKIYLQQGEPMLLHFEVGTLGDMNVAIAPHIATDGDI